MIVKETAVTTASPFVHSISGGAASILALVLLYPADFVRTKLQVGSHETPEYEKMQEETDIHIKSCENIIHRLQYCNTQKELNITRINVLKVLTALERRTLYLQEHPEIEEQEHILNANLEESDSDLSLNGEAIEKPVLTIKKVLVQVYDKYGISGFYKGLTSGLVGMGAAWGTYYYWYNSLLSGLPAEKTQKQADTFRHLLVAAQAGTITCIVTNPLWVVNTRVKLRKAKSKGVIPELIQLTREEGFAGWFRGLGPALVLVANPTIQFVVADFMKRRMLSLSKVGQLTSWHYFLLGALSKLVATVITYPYQVIKTLQQTEANANSDHPPQRGLWQSFLYVVRTKGVAGLYKGMEVKIYQTVLTSAFMFMFYEKLLVVVSKISTLLDKI